MSLDQPLPPQEWGEAASPQARTHTLMGLKAQATHIRQALGLDAESLLPTLSAGAAQNWFLEKRGATMLRNEFSVGFKLGLLHKDLKIVAQLARAAGTDHSIIDKSLHDYASLMGLGHADEDISALIRLKKHAG